MMNGDAVNNNRLSKYTADSNPLNPRPSCRVTRDTSSLNGIIPAPDSSFIADDNDRTPPSESLQNKSLFTAATHHCDAIPMSLNATATNDGTLSHESLDVISALTDSV